MTKAAAGQFGLKPYWGKPAVRNFREEEGNVTHDLMAFCHEAQKGGHNGSHWSNRRCAFLLLDSTSPFHSLLPSVSSSRMARQDNSHLDVLVLGHHPASYFAAALLRAKSGKSGLKVAHVQLPGPLRPDRLVVINPAVFDLHPLLTGLRKKLNCPASTACASSATIPRSGASITPRPPCPWSAGMATCATR